METDPNPDDGIHRRRLWWVIFSISLVALSIFWSVDSSLAYLILGVAAFSLFKILQHPQPRQTTQYHEQQPPIEKAYEALRPSQAWLFWQDVKEIFRKDATGPKTPQQAKVFVALVAGFIGFIFLITILAALFGGESSEDSAGHYQRATDYYNTQQYDSATYYYRLALVNDPENPDLYFERGNAFLNGNNTDSALIMYDYALSISPQHENAQYNKGYIYFNRKSYRQAIDETKKIMDYSPDNTQAMLLIGDSFYNQSQLDSALQWYEGAYSNGYRSAVLCHLMAYIYDVKGQTSTAINLYREAIGQDSTIRDIYVRLGELVPGEEGNWYRQKSAQMQ
jgi:tetratricopeptide (TPR) repeat protein